MRFILFIILWIPVQLVAQQEAARKVAYTHIKELHSGVLLVRIHNDDAVVAKMKSMHQDKLLKDKLEEIKTRTKEIYMAFTTGYTFTKVYFFYGRNSEKVKNGQLDGIFIGPDLKEDTTIKVPQNVPVYVMDVGDIYFEAFGGHFDGMIVMTNSFEALKKPFPYYVRKRSGFALIRRSYLDMVLLVQREFDKFYNESEHPRRQ